MVKLRLKRMGKINKPFYRIVCLDSRKKRDGAYLESIGYYDPKTDPLTLKVDTDKALYWLGKGAQPSDTVHSLLKKAGVMQKFHESKFGVSQTEETETKKKAKKVEKKTAEKKDKEAEKAVKEEKIEEKVEAVEDTKKEKKEAVKETKEDKPEEEPKKETDTVEEKEAKPEK